MAVSVNVPVLVRLFEEQHPAIGCPIVGIDPSSDGEAPLGHCVGIGVKNEDFEALRLEGCDLLLGTDDELGIGGQGRIGADGDKARVVFFDWPEDHSSGFRHGFLLIHRRTVSSARVESTPANDTDRAEAA